MIWPESCSMIREQPSSNKEARSLLAWFAICLSLPCSLPNMWSDGHFNIGTLSCSSSDCISFVSPNPEHRITNLKSIPPPVNDLLRVCWAQTKAAAMAAPWENPSSPSKGPSSAYTVLIYANDSSNPAVCCWYWRGSNGLSSIFHSPTSFFSMKSGATNHANFFLQCSKGGGGQLCCSSDEVGELQLWCDSAMVEDWYMNGNSWGASTNTSSAMFLSFLANDAVLPLKLEAFWRNPCRHKILSFLGGESKSVA